MHFEVPIQWGLYTYGMRLTMPLSRGSFANLLKALYIQRLCKARCIVHTNGALRSLLDFVHTYIHTYAHFGLFSYFINTLYRENFAHKGKGFLKLLGTSYTNMHILSFCFRYGGVFHEPPKQKGLCRASIQSGLCPQIHTHFSLSSYRYGGAS